MVPLQKSHTLTCKHSVTPDVSAYENPPDNFRLLDTPKSRHIEKGRKSDRMKRFRFIVCLSEFYMCQFVCLDMCVCLCVGSIIARGKVSFGKWPADQFVTLYVHCSCSGPSNKSFSLPPLSISHYRSTKCTDNVWIGILYYILYFNWIFLFIYFFFIWQFENSIIAELSKKKVRNLKDDDLKIDN